MKNSPLKPASIALYALLSVAGCSSDSQVARLINIPPYLVTPVAATASASGLGTTPMAVYDEETPGSFWDSGGSAPQWLQLDLGSPRPLTRVLLSVVQDTSGYTSHRIYGGLTADTMELLVTLSGNTVNGQLLEAEIPATAPPLIRYLKVETTQNPSSVSWGKIQVWADPTNFPLYFGFHANADGAGEEYGDAPIFTSEIVSFANVSWIADGSTKWPDETGFAINLQYAISNDLKGVVNLPQYGFFNSDLSLVADLEDRWNTFAEIIEPYADGIAFFYLMDEPYAQGKVCSGIPAATMKARIETLNRLVKARFPGIPTAISLNSLDFAPQDSPFADLSNPLPAGVDYIGFDCYGSWEQCGNPNYPTHSIPWYIDQIKAKLGPNQKTYLVADAFVPEAVPGDPEADAAQARLRLIRANQFYQLALSDPTVVGLFGFLYHDNYSERLDDGIVHRFLGVRYWPELRAKYKTIGRAITGK